MKKFILIQILLTSFYYSNAEECGLNSAGAIIQQVTNRTEYPDGLFWDGDVQELLYVNRFAGQICCLKNTGDENCLNVQGITNASSIYPVKKEKNKFLLLADEKMFLLTLNMNKEGKVTSIDKKTIVTITKNKKYTLMQSTIDSKGRIFVEAGMDRDQKTQIEKLFKVDTNEVVTELQVKLKNTGGLVFTSDYKYLFIGDSIDNVVYKYDFNNKDGTLGNREIVFNITEYTNIRGCTCTLEITSKNELWISICKSGLIILLDWKHNNQISQIIKIPTSYPLSLTYGGKYNDVLFASTKKGDKELAASEPGSGAIYAISGTGTSGLQKPKPPLPK